MMTTALHDDAGLVLRDPLAGARVGLALPVESLREELAGELRAAGCAVTCVEDAGRALLGGLEERFDAVVVSLTDVMADALCAALRDRFGSAVPVVLIGQGREDEAAVLHGLEVGARDCLLEPISGSLLRAKLRRLLAQVARADRSAVTAGALVLDPRAPGRFGEYDLQRVLGAGGYGTVYQARRLADGRAVAVKLLATGVGDDREQLARFLREVRVLRGVESPRVVRVLGAGYERGRYFLVMELVVGTPAHELAGGQNDVAGVALVGAHVGEAVEALHARGLVHRDIKPANIIIDHAGDATLVDFGLAKRRNDHAVTHTSQVLGTLPYLAPEVVRGEAPDVGSDLYALGVTLWELLAGARPFTASSDLALLRLIAGGKATADIGQRRHDVPVALSSVLAALMHPDPARRLRDPGQARAALAEAAGGRRSDWASSISLARAQAATRAWTPRVHHGPAPGSSPPRECA